MMWGRGYSSSTSRYGSGERFKDARKRIGLRQKDMAEILGISPAYLSLIETGRQPVSEPIAQAMQDKFNVDGQWLLYGNTTGYNAGTRLKSVRKQLGMTQAELGKAIGVSGLYIGLMERGGQAVSMPVASSMDTKYHISTEWLLYGVGSQYSR